MDLLWNFYWLPHREVVHLTSVTPGQNMLTPDQPVLALMPYRCQVSGRAASPMSILFITDISWPGFEPGVPHTGDGRLCHWTVGVINTGQWQLSVWTFHTHTHTHTRTHAHKYTHTHTPSTPPPPHNLSTTTTIATQHLVPLRLPVRSTPALTPLNVFNTHELTFSWTPLP